MKSVDRGITAASGRTVQERNDDKTRARVRRGSADMVPASRRNTSSGCRAFLILMHASSGRLRRRSFAVLPRRARDAARGVPAVDSAGRAPRGRS